MPNERARVREKFWRKVRKSRRPDACWEWRGAHSDNGYGALRTEPRGPVIKAHRVAYLLEVGPIPDGLYVCHRCDNPRCVRPDHLFIGTQAENRRDAARKGRAARKLTWPDVRAMRAAYAAGVRGYEIARRRRMSAGVVYKILRGVIWTDPAYPPRKLRGSGAPASARSQTHTRSGQ
jgi:hypothetical protein